MQLYGGVGVKFFSSLHVLAPAVGQDTSKQHFIDVYVRIALIHTICVAMIFVGVYSTLAPLLVCGI